MAEQVVEKKDYVTPAALVLGAAGLGAGLYIYYKKKGEPGKFRFNVPVASPNSAPAGGQVNIHCEVNMEGGDAFDGVIIVQIIEGSWDTPSGDFIEQRSFPAKMKPGESVTVDYLHTAVRPSNQSRRDVRVSVVQGNQELASREFDDVFSVTESGTSFGLTRPNASPASSGPGTVLLTCPVKSNSAQTAIVYMRVFEGAAVGTGQLLDELSQSVVFGIGETKQLQFTHISQATSNNDRDVEIDVKVGGVTISKSRWADVFIVTPPSANVTVYPVTAYPVSSSPGPVLITCPISSTVAVNTIVRLSIFEGAAVGTGQLLDYQQLSVAINAGAQVNAQFMHRSAETSNADRDVKVEVFVDGQVAAVGQWPDVFSVISTKVDFRIEIDSATAPYVLDGVNRWLVYYYDPGISDYVGDNQWHFLSTRVNFDHVTKGGYLAVFLWNNSTGVLSPQINSSVWNIVHSHTYQFEPYFRAIIDIS